MGERSSIAWTDDTWNPWRGCTKVSPGCAHCYAEELVVRRLLGKWGKGQPRTKASEATLLEPLKWNKKPLVCDKGHFSDRTELGSCQDCGGVVHRRRVFSLSLGDWLDPEVDVSWLTIMLETVRRCDQLTWILCTKRPDLFRIRIGEVLNSLADSDLNPFLFTFLSKWLCGIPPRNVWVLTSVENQAMADLRIPLLFKIPAAIHGLSCEPLLEKVDLMLQNDGGLDWLIIGGESGKHRRDCGIEAIMDLTYQGTRSGTSTFVKQDCAYAPGQQGRIPDDVWKLLKQFPDEA